MSQEEHEELHRQLEREADDLGRQERELSDKIDRTRDDWESRKASQSVPGAEGTEGGLEGLAEREDDDTIEADEGPEQADA